jgi:hypothetical protein
MQFDQYGKPVPGSTNSTWRDNLLFLGFLAMMGAGLYIVSLAYREDSVPVVSGTADATPGIMHVVVVADETEPTPEPTIPTCAVGLERNTTCMWRITPTPVLPCPPTLIPAQCTYDGPEDFREFAERFDGTPVAGAPLPN